MRIITFILVCLGLMVACEGNAQLRDLTDSELSSKRDRCLRNDPTAPGQVTACENIRKECDRRRAQGNFAC